LRASKALTREVLPAPEGAAMTKRRPRGRAGEGVEVMGGSLTEGRKQGPRCRRAVRLYFAFFLVTVHQ